MRMDQIDETFGDRVARLCRERNVSHYRILRDTGVRVTAIDRSKTVSLKAARAIASVLEMPLAELDAPILLTIGTDQAVTLGLVTDNPADTAPPAGRGWEGRRGRNA